MNNSTVRSELRSPEPRRRQPSRRPRSRPSSILVGAKSEPLMVLRPRCLTTLFLYPGGRSVGGVRGAVSTGRKFGEHHCRVLPSAFVVAHFADRFARRLHRQLADLALGLPRCLTFLPREAASATRSAVAVQPFNFQRLARPAAGSLFLLFTDGSRRRLFKDQLFYEQ